MFDILLTFSSIFHMDSNSVYVPPKVVLKDPVIAKSSASILYFSPFFQIKFYKNGICQVRSI